MSDHPALLSAVLTAVWMLPCLIVASAVRDVRDELRALREQGERFRSADRLASETSRRTP